MFDYFKLFDLAPSFDIDTVLLKEKYQEKARLYHPDNFVNADKKLQLKALQDSDLLNSAYQTLSNDLNRAAYLLKMKNIDVFSQYDTHMSNDFLLKQISLREQLDEISAQKESLALMDYLSEIKGELKNYRLEMSRVFAPKNTDLITAKQLVREYKFYQQLQKQAQGLLDEWLI